MLVHGADSVEWLEPPGGLPSGPAGRLAATRFRAGADGAGLLLLTDGLFEGHAGDGKSRLGEDGLLALARSLAALAGRRVRRRAHRRSRSARTRPRRHHRRHRGRARRADDAVTAAAPSGAADRPTASRLGPDGAGMADSGAVGHGCCRARRGDRGSGPAPPHRRGVRSAQRSHPAGARGGLPVAGGAARSGDRIARLRHRGRPAVPRALLHGQRSRTSCSTGYPAAYR